MKLQDEWAERICIECGARHIVNIAWNRPPRLCKRCRAMRVDNKKRKLDVYFNQLSTKKEKRLSKLDHGVLKNIPSIRDSIKEYCSQNSIDSTSGLQGLMDIEFVADILLAVNKENNKSKTTRRQRDNLSTQSASKVHGVFQGGAPGLGKKK